MDDDKLYTTEQAAAFTGLSKRTINYRREAGELPFYRAKNGVSIRYKKADLLALFERVGVSDDDETNGEGAACMQDDAAKTEIT